MRRRRPLLVLASALTAAIFTAAGALPTAGSAAAKAPAGAIYFVSARATENPGEILALSAGKHPQPVFPSPYADLALATAPKGRAFAFWSDRSGRWRVMLSADGRRLRTVAILGAGVIDAPTWAPVFSPDGKRVVIPYMPHDAIAQIPALAVADVAQGPAAPLSTPCGSPPAWAPDGRALACSAADGKTVLVSDTGGHVELSVKGTAVLWSADGRLAVSGAKGTTVMRAAGRAVAHVAGVARAWSPDGQTLAVTRPAGLALVRPGRSGAPRVLPTGASVWWVAFTPDGKDVAYANGRDGLPQIAAVAGGAPQQFRATAGGTWSRDGRYAALVTVARARVLIGDDARAQDVSGPLPYDEQGASTLAWLGDGSRLLYDGSSPGIPQLWAMGTGGAGQTRLTGNAWPISEPAWSRDGSKVAYGASGFFGGDGIVIASAEGKKLSVVHGADAGDHTNDGSPSWSPDGTQVAVADDQAGGVAVLSVADGTRTPVAADGAEPAWSPDGATIAFVDLDDGTVWGSAPDGSGRRRLLPATVKGVRSLAWRPDGKRLAYTTDTALFIGIPDAKAPGRRIAAAALPGRPSFSPDGTQIAFAADTDATHPYRAIFVVGTNGSGLRQLTKGPYDSGDPAWRPA